MPIYLRSWSRFWLLVKFQHSMVMGETQNLHATKHQVISLDSNEEDVKPKIATTPSHTTQDYLRLPIFSWSWLHSDNRYNIIVPRQLQGWSFRHHTDLVWYKKRPACFCHQGEGMTSNDGLELLFLWIWDVTWRCRWHSASIYLQLTRITRVDILDQVSSSTQLYLKFCAQFMVDAWSTATQSTPHPALIHSWNNLCQCQQKQLLLLSQ